MKQLVLFTVLTFTLSIATSQHNSDEVISKSINFHDPDNALLNSKMILSLAESRPGNSDRRTIVTIDMKKEFFKIDRTVDDDVTIMTLDKGKSSFLLNGSATINEKQRAEHRLTEERLMSTKNYYRYLWLLPLALQDPGTIVDQPKNNTDFFGKICIEIKITYTPEVGEDIWYFYFNPLSFALEGYRFYHDEEANDGEYIILSELTSSDKVKLPKIRKWYTHKENKYLGADVLESLTIK